MPPKGLEGAAMVVLEGRLAGYLGGRGKVGVGCVRPFGVRLGVLSSGFTVSTSKLRVCGQTLDLRRKVLNFGSRHCRV